MSRHLAPFRNAHFRHARNVAAAWLSEMSRRGEIAEFPPTLYQAYVCDGWISRSAYNPRSLSDYFDAGSSDPRLAEARLSLIRLLSIAVKAHFFLFRLDLVQEEPSVFWVPDLMRPQVARFGIQIPFLKSRKSLMVSDADLLAVSAGKIGIGRFPVVLTSDHNAWLDERHWETLAEDGDAARLIQETLSVSESMAARSYSDPGTFPFGTLFDIPEDLRPQMRAAGLRWAEGVGRMYLPKGFDSAPVEAYFVHLKERYDSAKALASGSAS